MKTIKFTCRRINFWFEMGIFILGFILSILCIYDSVSIMKNKYELIHNADVWGNAIYPQVAANSYLGTFCEKNYCYVFLVGITVIITLIPIQSSCIDTLYSNDTKKYSIASIFFDYFKLGFFSVFIILSFNILLTLAFIPNLSPEMISWEFIDAESELMQYLYKEHSIIYILVCSIRISAYAGLVADFSILFYSIKKIYSIIIRLACALFILAYSHFFFYKYDWNMFYILDPANRHGQGFKTNILFGLMIVTNLFVFALNKKILRIRRIIE